MLRNITKILKERFWGYEKYFIIIREFERIMDNDIRIKKIRPEEEEAVAAAASGAIPANYTMTDYRNWQEVKEELRRLGLESTGNYQADLKLRNEIRQMDDIQLEQLKEVQKVQRNRATENVTRLNEADQEVIKDFSNMQSSQILADIMKYYYKS